MAVPTRAQRILTSLAIGAAVAVSAAWTLLDRRPPPLVTLTTPQGPLQVALASTAKLRAQGLSDRDAPFASGLLLTWDAPGEHPIWMQGMRFPLDLIWLDRNDQVLALLTDVPVCTSSPCPLYHPAGTSTATAVLEVASGDAARHHIAVGLNLPRKL
jgi:uncharacterized membrane protein (UPF0127 family)